MAIDTRNKRSSVSNIHFAFNMPEPDGTVDVYDRQQVGLLYAGIDTTVIPAGDGGDDSSGLDLGLGISL
jgi:hypothetical protein